MADSIEDLEQANAIFVIGSNTTECHPVIGVALKRAAQRGVPLIVADPRAIELTEFATVHLQQKHGTDVALINGLMHVILQEGLEDRDYIDRRTEGFEQLEAAVEPYTPEFAEKISGIAAEDTVEAARLYATASAASIIYSMGMTQHTTGTDNVLSLANLAMVTGNLGKPGAGVNPLRGQNNVQGACDMGALPDVYSGYQKEGTFTNTERRVQRVHKALEPPGEARGDWQIICDFASRGPTCSADAGNCPRNSSGPRQRS